MRRTAVAIAAIAITVVGGLGLTATVLVRAHSRATTTGSAASAALAALVAEGPASPGDPPIAVADQPDLTLVANVTSAPVPASSLVATPKPALLGYSGSPGGPIIGQLPARKWGAPVVRPVVQQILGGWLELRLDTRPNASTGWVRQKDVTITSTPYRIVISVSQRSLTFYQNGQVAYAGLVGVGRAQTATPIAPSFVDAVVAVPRSQQYIYGPVAIITASHSNVYTQFDGGDGSVGIHGYPSDPASTQGVASSHGCVRANPQTMAALANVGVGTPVDIVA